MSKRRLKPTSDGRDHEDDPPMSRLFVVCNKNITDKNIRESFSKFGKFNLVAFSSCFIYAALYPVDIINNFIYFSFK
jgi:hypothetical protein